MRGEAVLTSEVDSTSNDHLLQHYKRDTPQEDLCFALWHPSTGKLRRTALIDEIILPQEGERLLHGNVSFEPAYLARAMKIALQKKARLAFMYSHPSDGWQGMSAADVEAERDVLAYPAGATGLPLVGLTIGTDGCWSARFWERDGEEMRRHWCEKVRVVGPQSYKIYFNDDIAPPPLRRDILRRTFDTWGRESQNTISRLKVGIVGLGSVGCIVAEAMARIGIAQVTLIDPDKVEEHNLDRLLYGTVHDIGRLKVDLAARAMRRNATAESIQITALPVSVHNSEAYKAALDCDLLFSCVDRPVARDVLNYLAQAHLIPVIDGGIAVETDRRKDSLFSAHWRAHLVTPYHQCLRCSKQYNSSMVVVELDGSLDDPSYVSNLPPEERVGNQNVFPWYNLSDPAMEDSLYDVESMRRFAGVSLNDIPDETTICKFRHFLRKHGLPHVLFDRPAQYLSERGLLMREGTIVDATIVAAPSSTKNRDRTRDPEMGSTKKGTAWHFGLKAHVGSDPHGRVHRVVVTSASVHDAQVMADCLHGDEQVIYGDKAYADAQRQKEAEAQGIQWRVHRKATRGRKRTCADRSFNRKSNRVRARVEHSFGLIKHLWGYRTVRYRGLANNAAQLVTLFALANLYLVRRPLRTA